MERRIEIKPYLYIQYDYYTLNEAIRSTKSQNLYSCMLRFTTTRPKVGKSPKIFMEKYNMKELN